ncbi:MAG: glycosyltransferase [Bacteroidales bacterium]|nr:glycosyltransferase [Bacteroidales bacterium]
MITISLTLASVIGVFLFFGIGRIKDILIGYGQSRLERGGFNPFYCDRLRDDIYRKNIYGIEEALLRRSIKELLSNIKPSPTSTLKMHLSIFKKHKTDLNILKSLLLVIIIYVIVITIYEQYLNENFKCANIFILFFFDLIIIFSIWYSIFKTDGIEKQKKGVCKDLYKRLEYAKLFLDDLKNDCNSNSSEKIQQEKSDVNEKCIIKSNISIRNDTIPMTIVIPIYNAEKYLNDCMYSVINQTMKEIQIICVNDGSTDNSSMILQKYAKKDNRIKIIDKIHEGSGKARNTAFPYIKGKYVLFVDADDWIELDTCQKLYDVAEKTKAQLVQFLFYMQNDSNQTDVYIEEYVRYKFYQDNLQYKDNMLIDKISNLPILQTWNKLWQTSFLRYNNLCFENITGAGGDIIMSWKGIVLAKDIAVLPEKLYYYRYRESSLSHKKGNHYANMINSCNKIYNFLIEQELYNDHQYRIFFLSKKLEIYFRFGQKIISVKDKKEYKQLFLESLTDDMKDFYFYETFKKHWFQHM